MASNGNALGRALAPFMREEVDSRLDRLYESLDSHAQGIAESMERIEYAQDFDDIVNRMEVATIANPGIVTVKGPPLGTFWKIDSIAVIYSVAVAGAVSVLIHTGPLPASGAAAGLGERGSCISAKWPGIAVGYSGYSDSFNGLIITSDITAYLSGAGAAGTVALSVMGRQYSE